MSKLPSVYQEFIHLSRYSRWLTSSTRRETWSETVDRYLSFFNTRFPFGEPLLEEIRTIILSTDVMPSMRCLMAAGEALNLDNMAGYNCSYRAIDDIKAFDEIFYILMCGTGVGFSVERQFIAKLPTVHEDNSKLRRLTARSHYPNCPRRDLSDYDAESGTIIVADTRLGWASAMRKALVELYCANYDIKWDLSKLRPAGSILRTFGGRASGPGPLDELLNFAVRLFKKVYGRKLTSIECHDLVCKIADVVVAGGVRRSALLSLSNLSDVRMANAKSGSWWIENGQRALSNNSVCYTETPDIGSFMDEWKNLYASKAGERGIFNRAAATKKVASLNNRDPNHAWGTNPCAEILLRNKGLCNLSEVVIRPDDTEHSLTKKVRLATILGTVQATLTDFRYLSEGWTINTKEEALLGVSLTGIMDHPVYRNPSDLTIRTLTRLRMSASHVNADYARQIGINTSAAITCVKPSGTVSQLVDSASGIHPRYSKYYIRRVRNDNKDPMTVFMKDAGVPYEADVTAPGANGVFSFPQKSPEGAMMRKCVSALRQLELWKCYADHWCDHKPSCTVYVRESEWLEVGAWIYKNFDSISGLSFLPFNDDDHIYRQAPYEECSQETYAELLKQIPTTVDWSALKERIDPGLELDRELACTAGACDI